MIAMAELHQGMLIGLGFIGAICGLCILGMILFPDPGLPQIRNFVCLICGHEAKHLVHDSTRPYCRCGNHMTRLPEGAPR